MNYPTIVYKDGGAHHRPGGMYSWKSVNSEAEHKTALADGWFDSLSEAIEGVSNSAPTRQEMELKAKELGLKFDGRTTDAKLLKMIEGAL